jgi:transcriptional regulator with XRE-family HTH domain
MILKRERIARKLSMTRLAEKAALSRQMVSYVERGMRVPTLDTLLRITAVLGIKASDVLARAERN